MNENIFEKVYEVTRIIPRGKVATYGEIARVLNKNYNVYNNYNDYIANDKEKKQKIKISPQLVGWALHANKDKNTPCHRVVDRNGKIALNFAFDGYREQKRRLEEEGVEFLDEMHVDLKRFLQSL